MEACGSSDCALLASGGPVMDIGLAFHPCPTCGARRVPDEKLIHEVVEPDAPGKTPLAMRILFRIRSTWLAHCVPILGRKDVAILDVGCGDGQFLEYLRDRGFRRCVGVEVNPDRLHEAVGRGLTAHLDLKTAIADHGPTFSVIFLWHVLEHVREPVSLLRELAGAMDPQGVIVVSVPNHRSWQTRVFRRYSSFLAYGHHVWFLDSGYFAWLQEQLPQHRITRIRDLSFEYEMFGWIDTLVSATFQRVNYVHTALKKGRASPAGKLVAVGMSLIYLPLACLLSVFTLVFKDRASTLTYVIARETVENRRNDH